MKKNGDWLYENNYPLKAGGISSTDFNLTGTFNIVFSFLNWKIKSKYENYF